MPFTCKQYEDNFGIVRLELAVTEDSQIKVLLLKQEGNLSSQITFTQENINRGCSRINLIFHLQDFLTYPMPVNLFFF